MQNVQGLRPGSPVSGTIAVPCSKSLAQRAIVCASLAGGTTRITSLDPIPTRGADLEHALRLVQVAGASVESLAPGAVAITGRPPGPHRGWRPTKALETGESGTLARFATAALAFCGEAGRAFEITGRGTLLRRSSAPLFAALLDAGVGIEPVDGSREDSWPVRIRPIGPPPVVTIIAPKSSQEVSALAIALAAYPDTTRLVVDGSIPSRPYLEMTISMLHRFGVRIERVDMTSTAEAFDVRGPLLRPEAPISIEPDASAAAVALAAGCLSGGSVEIAGLGSRSGQGDVRIAQYLRAFGCDVQVDEAAIRAQGRPVRGAVLDLGGEPDLAPVLAIIAAFAASNGGGPSRLLGLETLQGKESPRIDVLAEGLRSVGVGVLASKNELSVAAGTRSERSDASPILLDPRGDHRMVFAFALLGLCLDGVRVRDASCVEKSWPGFWTAMHRGGASGRDEGRERG